jgi:hypothetical protein
MEDKGYVFTPLAFLLFIPVIILAVSFSGIVNEVNTLSAIVVGGDVTSTAANNIVEAIQQDTQDDGRYSAFQATVTVINNYNLHNNPYFGTSPGTDSRSYIESNTLTLLNQNLTNTCRVIEQQTGRTITINGYTIDPNGASSYQIFTSSNMNISQSDPYGFNITLTPVPVTIQQNSTTNNQSYVFNTPALNVYISIIGLEDPYIWVNTYAHNNSAIYPYPYYKAPNNIIGGSNSSIYHMGDQVSAGKLNHLNETFYINQTLVGGINQTTIMSYYFPDVHGLTFFDRLENRTNNTSPGPNSAKMSTFILWNPNYQNMPGYTPSYLDHEYFAGINGTPITTTHAGVVTNVTDPIGNVFYLSNTYQGILGLLSNYNY